MRLVEHFYKRLVKHFIPFSQDFDKFNNTGARMLDSIYHLTLRLL